MTKHLLLDRLIFYFLVFKIEYPSIPQATISNNPPIGVMKPIGLKSIPVILVVDNR